MHGLREASMERSHVPRRRVASRWRPRAEALAIALAAALVACGGSSAAPGPDAGLAADAGAVSDAGTVEDGGLPLDAGVALDAGLDGGPDKAATCASTFGTALTNAAGRLDGIVRAVVPPAHPTCALPNDDHLVLQVDVAGATYRMVLNVRSDRAGQDPRVHLLELPHALTGRAWQEGWWPNEKLDYVTTLGARSNTFTPYEMTPLVQRVTALLGVGARVSVYAISSGGASAHLIHRNSANRGDGALVIDPTSSSPLYLLFRFADQVF